MMSQNLYSAIICLLVSFRRLDFNYYYYDTSKVKYL